MFKKIINCFIVLLLISATMIFTSCGRQNKIVNNKLKESLSVNFKGNAKISVGSYYAGVELHHSSILPQRISFYYPVANSIDLSTDYWKRDTTFIMAAGLKVGDGKKEWIGLKPYEYNLTPFSVTLNKSDEEKSVKVSYQFCKDKPAMIISYEITNNSDKAETFEFYTHLETSLKTCHTYALKDKANTQYDKNGNAIYANFNDIGTDSAQVFVANAGEQPVSYNTSGSLNNSRTPNNDWWFSHNGNLQEKTFSKSDPGIPAAEYLYKKKLAPKETMKVVQIVGSSKQDEGHDIVNYLLKNYKKEVNNYENFVLEKSYNDGVFSTGDSAIDHSAHWAKAILGANKHYIDGQIIAMPCPAEYNFYFTHDVLLTDLAAVNFDLPRVKHDLKFVVSHSSKDKVIPHAFYWKDSAFVTEFASSDNWNNFWFIITAASYLRHSSDTALLNYMYPYLTKSLQNALKTKKEDDVVWSYRPDWWDIGNNFGPRVYMTILATKTLREYNYISTVLGKNKKELLANDELADRMEKQVTNKFWDSKQKYLINYFNDGTIDHHYYIGSLLAADYGMLDKTHMDELIQTAKDKLLDDNVGVYTAFPMDFLKYKKKLGYGDEVGKPYYYFNGGIWPQDNSWYAEALIKNGEKENALNFLKKTMTLEGIINGPNGQPAMYEVRNADKDDPSVYGSVDKPQFMWAGGWYLHTLYRLFGVSENDWNISFNPFLYNGQKSCSFTLNAYGNSLLVNITGKGSFIKSLKYDGKRYASAVIPSTIKNVKNADIILGHPDEPYLKSSNAVLKGCNYNENNKSLSFTLDAFTGHRNISKLISPFPVKEILVNGKEIKGNWKAEKVEDIYKIEINTANSVNPENIEIKF